MKTGELECKRGRRNVMCSGEMLRYVTEPVKLKGIDGGPHKRRNMWFNSMIREEPYPGLKVSDGG